MNNFILRLILAIFTLSVASAAVNEKQNSVSFFECVDTVQVMTEFLEPKDVAQFAGTNHQIREFIAGQITCILGQSIPPFFIA